MDVKKKIVDRLLEVKEVLSLFETFDLQITNIEIMDYKESQDKRRKEIIIGQSVNLANDYLVRNEDWLKSDKKGKIQGLKAFAKMYYKVIKDLNEEIND